jgi:hypothetical protein
MVTPVRPYRERREQLDPLMQQYLLTGQPAAMRWLGRIAPEQVWATYRDRILARWIDEFPGTRPFAFWEFEELPPRLNGEYEADYLTRNNMWWPGERRAARR